ncbi:MAG: FMN-binding protein, partial [Treponema sp.]|nr:FMN-binding protein [Treponema sp.]
MSSNTSTKNEGIFSMLKLGLILAAYAVASCTVLALVNNFTAPVIEQNNIRKANEAMRAVFADADDFEQVKDDSLPIDSLYFAKKGGN